MRRKLVSVGMAVCIFVGSMSGCAGVGKLENKEAKNQGEATSEETAGLYPEDKNTRWRDTCAIKRNDIGEEMTISIDAKIAVPDADSMSVVEVQGWSTEKIEKNKVILGKKVKDISLEYTIEKRKEVKNTMLTYISERSDATYVVDDEGIGGIYLEAKEEDLKKVTPEEIKKVTEVFYSPGQDAEYDEKVNTCKISEDEARAEAEEFLARLDLSGQTLIESEPLIWRLTEEPENSDALPKGAAHGYHFCYRPGAAGVDFSSFGDEQDYYWELYNFDKGYYQEDDSFNCSHYYVDYPMNNGITLDVTEQGVIQASISAPLKILSETKNVNLLPLKNVKEIMKESMEDFMNQYFERAKKMRYKNWDHVVRHSFDKLELAYFRIPKEEGNNVFSYVPVWRLMNDSGGASPTMILMVNAIDGTVIDLWDCVTVEGV